MALDKDYTCAAVFINVSLLGHRSDQIFPQNIVVNFTLKAAGRQRNLFCIPFVKLILVSFILNLETFCLLEFVIYCTFWSDIPKEIFHYLFYVLYLSFFLKTKIILKNDLFLSSREWGWQVPAELHPIEIFKRQKTALSVGPNCAGTCSVQFSTRCGKKCLSRNSVFSWNSWRWRKSRDQ